MLKILALNSTKEYGQKIAEKLEVPLCDHEEFLFADGECFVAPRENIRGCDVFILQSLYEDDKEDLHQKLMKLFLMCGAAWDASADRITLVCPYFCYGRQDRKTSSRCPITTKYLSHMIEAVDCERMLCMDVHNLSAEQNAFRLRCDFLESRILFAKFIAEEFSGRPLTVLSPDDGRLKQNTLLYQSLLNYGLDVEEVACVYKTHTLNEIKAHNIMGDVEGKDVIIFDDLISSGKTIHEASQAAKRKGARRIAAVCAPHGLFVGKANEYLEDPFIERIVITDTIPPFRIKNSKVKAKLTVLPTTSLFAEAIRCIHTNKSISDLIQTKKR